MRTTDPAATHLRQRAVSTTDPAATHLRQRDGVHLGYPAHDRVDGGSARIMLGALVTPAEVPEDWPAADLAWRARFRWRLWPRQATGAKASRTLGLIRAREDQHVRAYIPLPDFDSRSSYVGKRACADDPTHDAYTCPHGHTLRYRRLSRGPRIYRYKGEATTCNACPLKARCTPSSRGRVISRSYDEASVDRMRADHATAPYQKAIRKPSVWTEPLFGEAKQWHGLRHFRLRRLWRVNSETLLTASGQNLKRLLSRAGWGRRPFPDGALGLRIAPGPLAGLWSGRW